LEVNLASDSIPGIDPAIPPSGTGCVECLAGKGAGWWLHLRRCMQCGHIGCCDTSPSQHASHHAREAGHPYISSFEPGENWFYSYPDDSYLDGKFELAPPTSHPYQQPVPSPEEKLPPNWQDMLH
jgi:hypothetical protein